MVMGFATKRYFGGIKGETTAARIYDKYTILSQGKATLFYCVGMSASTNYSYTARELEGIMENEYFETLP
jgi:hypothetical protein